MAGTVSGSVDHVHVSAVAANQNQEVFTTIFRFFNGPLRSGSYVEPVAYSTGSAAGGTNFHDESNPFRENAFFVFRFVTGSISGTTSKRTNNLYVCFQWADTNLFNATPGAPGALLGLTYIDGIGLSAAWRADGGNPWGGSTRFDGTDTKGSLVWVSGSSTVYAYPRSNASGGSFATNTENMARICDAGTTTANRWHMVADRDNFIFVFDSTQNTSVDWFTVLGVYDPIPALSGTFADPVFMINSNPAGTALNIITAVKYGGAAGTAATQGGIHGTSGSVTVRDLIIDRYGFGVLADTTLQPNTQYALANYDEFKVPLIMYDGADKGFLGYAERISEVYNANSHDITADGQRVAFGQASTNTIKTVIPWSGSAPGTTSTRAGRQF